MLIQGLTVDCIDVPDMRTFLYGLTGLDEIRTVTRRQISFE